MLSILIFAHVPPPHHGQSYMVAQLLAELRAYPDEVRVFHVDSRVSSSLEEVGRMQLGKVWRMLLHCGQAIRLRLRHGAMVFYYVPAPAQKGALLRDWLVMTLCRPFFRRRLILHWHAVGLGRWLASGEAGLSTRWFSRRALGGADLSLVLARSVADDANVFHPKQTRILPNGIPDPCPDFDRVVLPARLTRARDQANGVFRVLFMAHCTPEKGLYDALAGAMDAQSQLHATGSSTRIYLTVAGQFLRAEERRAFLDTVARLAAGRPADSGPPPEVECVGFAAGGAKDRLLRESDCFCFPTYYPNEVMPVSLIEAMAYGLPIVASRWRAIPEMLPASGSFLVDPHRSDEVATALCAALGNQDFADLRAHFLEHSLRRVFGRRFLTTVQECFPAVAPARPVPQ